MLRQLHQLTNLVAGVRHLDAQAKQFELGRCLDDVST